MLKLYLIINIDISKIFQRKDIAQPIYRYISSTSKCKFKMKKQY